MKSIDHLMQQGVIGNVFPGAACLVAKKYQIIHFNSYGYSNIFSMDLDRDKSKVTKDTVFDLASLTKPLATVLVVMLLMQQKKIDLENCLSFYIPQFKNTAKAKIKIKNLLYHNSGLPAYKPYYIKLKDVCFEKREKLKKQMLIDEPLVSSIGKKVLYSDLGFMILKWICESIISENIDSFLYRNIYKVLGIENLFFIKTNELPNKNYDFAATEFCLWRNKILDGFVSDDNTCVVGGVDGQAGLFGTANAVFKLLDELLKVYYGDANSNLFDQEIVKTFFKIDKNITRTLGFDIPSQINSSSGNLFSKKSIGHLGFTGTSFWIDLEKNILIILLTNRVHPSRYNIKIRKFRPILHNLIMENI